MSEKSPELTLESVLLWALRTAEGWGAAHQRAPADLALAELVTAIEGADKEAAARLFELAEKTLLVYGTPIRLRLVWGLVFGCAALYTGRRSSMTTYLDALAELAAVDAHCAVDRAPTAHLGPRALRRYNGITLPGLRSEAMRKARKEWKDQIAKRTAALRQS